MIACLAVALCIVQPYLILKAFKGRERVVVLDGAGTFAVSPVLGFEEAKELHEAMTLWATLALMNESDEFVRALTAKRFIIASGLSMALFSAWGFAESYGGAWHAPGWLIYPLFWGLFGLVSPFVRDTGR